MLYNRLIEHVLLPLGDLALGTSYHAELRRWRALQWQSAEALEALQRERLERMLAYCVERVPYYRALAPRRREDPYEWIREFPVMDKQRLRSHTDELLTRDRRGLIKVSTSGSSGVHAEVYQGPHDRSAALAAQTLLWEWGGFRPGRRVLQFGITRRGPFKRMKDLLFRTWYVDAFTLDRARIVSVLEALRKHPRELMLGYASSLYLYAKTAREEGIDDVRFEGVVSWGDKMFPHYRQAIETQFHTRVTDVYGSAEGFVIGGQCEHGGFHILTPHVHLELLDKDRQPVRPGEMGYVVATRLDARAMPLVRYYLGDLAVRAPEERRCACGRNLPLLERVIGRDTDIVRTPSGGHMIVHFFTALFGYVPEIAQFRVVQRELKGIEIEFVPAPGFHDGVLERLRGQILERLNEDFEIRFTRVDHIPASPSGKPQIVHSALEGRSLVA